MKSKKLIAMGLAVVMTAALAVPALAEDTVITGMYEEIKIDVEIPNTGTAVINPYEMPVKAMYKATPDAKGEEVAALTTAGKIATQPLIGVSTCEVALDVGATVTGTPKGNLMLSNKDISAAKTTSAVVYLECKQDMTLSSAEISSTDSDKPISGIKGQEAVAAFNAWPTSTYDFGTTDAAKAANADKVLVTESGSTKLGLCTLAAAKDNAGTMEPQTGSFLLARLGGDVVQSPTDGWTAKDGVVVNVAFTFTPAAPKVGGAITLSEASAGTGPVAVVAAPEGVTFAADATYEWTIVDPGTTNVDRIAQSKNAAMSNSVGTTLAAGAIKIACTVTSDGIKYVTPATEVTLTA